MSGRPMTPAEVVMCARAAKVAKLIRRTGGIDGMLALSYVVWPEGPPSDAQIERGVRKFQRKQARRLAKAA